MSTVIKVENIGKQYRLGQVGTGTLSHDLNRFWHRMRGKEDPYLKVGEMNDRSLKGNSDWVWALKDINFEVQQGEVLGIIGKNGAGKSTLLKILSQVTSPTLGEIKIKGRIASLLEVGTGFHPELTGRENIFLNGAILGMTKAEIKSKLDEIVDFSGVEKYLDTPVKRYSSGMMVRLGFAVAAHLEPEILIVDEVLAVGDAEFQEKCIGKMKEVSGSGRTVLFVSHNIGVINQLCSRTILLKNGALIANDITANVVEKYLDLESNYSINEYSADSEKLAEKKIAFISIFSENSKGLKTNQFTFHEDVVLKVKIKCECDFKNTKISITLLNKHQARIFTLVNDLVNFEKEKDCLNFKVRMPKEIIAPNVYSFRFAIFQGKGSVVFDLLESVCPIKINDTGSEMAVFEGLDYGSVIIRPQWIDVK